MDWDAVATGVALVAGGLCFGLFAGIIIMHLLVIKAFWDVWK